MLGFTTQLFFNLLINSAAPLNQLYSVRDIDLHGHVGYSG